MRTDLNESATRATEGSPRHRFPREDTKVHWLWDRAVGRGRALTDTLHRTDLQLLQAKNLCPEAEEHKRREARAIQIKRAEELREVEDHRRKALKEELRELELLEQQLEKLPPPN